MSLFLIELCGLVVLSTLQVTPVTCTRQNQLVLTASSQRNRYWVYSESLHFFLKCHEENSKCKRFYLISTDLRIPKPVTGFGVFDHDTDQHCHWGFPTGTLEIPMKNSLANSVLLFNFIGGCALKRALTYYYTRKIFN